MTFQFHAAPPRGEWMNDPNGLVFAGGRFRLFAQHSAVGPDFREIGWARLSSDDLIRWEWNGPVIASDASGHAYSGSVRKEGPALQATLTRHDPAGPVQRQMQLTSADAGLSWAPQGGMLGPEGRNVRDPFITPDGAMLLAEPCDWTGWHDEPPSRLSIWRQHAGDWVRAGGVGPWHPQGIMWEVPAFIDFGAAQALIISTVDRRDGGARCAVTAWIGRLEDGDFRVTGPAEGQRLDLGPDFYAAIPNASDHWPLPETLIVGWASSWATARKVKWPGGIHGGPISLPRTVTLDGCRLRVAPLRGARPLVAGTRPLGGGLNISTDGATLALQADGTDLLVRRTGDPLLDWSERHAGVLDGPQQAAIFIDSGLVEIFLEPAGVSVTAFVPGATPASVPMGRSSA